MNTTNSHSKEKSPVTDTAEGDLVQEKKEEGGEASLWEVRVKTVS